MLFRSRARTSRQPPGAAGSLAPEPLLSCCVCLHDDIPRDVTTAISSVLLGPEARPVCVRLSHRQNPPGRTIGSFYWVSRKDYLLPRSFYIFSDARFSFRSSVFRRSLCRSLLWTSPSSSVLRRSLCCPSCGPPPPLSLIELHTFITHNPTH